MIRAPWPGSPAPWTRPRWGEADPSSRATRRSARRRARRRYHRRRSTAGGSSYGHRAAGAERRDLRLRVARAKDGVAGDKRVRAGAEHVANRVAPDAAVHLERGTALFFVEQQSRAPNLVDGIGDELLPAEPGVDRHDEQELELGHDLAYGRERRSGVERHARAAAQLANAGQLAVQVRRGFGVDRQAACAGRGEVVEIFFR